MGESVGVTAIEFPRLPERFGFGEMDAAMGAFHHIHILKACLGGLDVAPTLPRSQQPVGDHSKDEEKKYSAHDFGK